jgi:hypothetical protein
VRTQECVVSAARVREQTGASVAAGAIQSTVASVAAGAIQLTVASTLVGRGHVGASLNRARTVLGACVRTSALHRAPALQVSRERATSGKMTREGMYYRRVLVGSAMFIEKYCKIVAVNHLQKMSPLMEN